MSDLDFKKEYMADFEPPTESVYEKFMKALPLLDSLQLPRQYQTGTIGRELHHFFALLAHRGYIKFTAIPNDPSRVEITPADDIASLYYSLVLARKGSAQVSLMQHPGFVVGWDVAEGGQK